MSATPGTPALDTPDASPRVAAATVAPRSDSTRSDSTRSDSARSGPAQSGSARPQLRRVRPRHLALLAILAFSAFLNTYRLAQNGYANVFYSAAVKSMLGSLHDFLYVSSDPGGLITIDKPPLAAWVQVASAKLFGFSPLSLLLPEAIVSTIAVAVLYRVIARRLGAVAALAGAVALAVFPSFVAVSRDNGVDPLLILLLILASGAALNAIEDGRWRWLLCCAALIGLAFNTKTLAAYLVVPGIALGYLVCAPGSIRRRAGGLLAAGAVMAIVSFSWIAFVELTPASQRPFVGSSTDNTEIGLTFDYNGFGRVQGETGGPGRTPVAEGGGLQIAPRPAARAVALKRGTSKYLPNGRLGTPVVFGQATGPLRLFEAGLDGQGAWLLPFALFGMLALALLTLADRRARRNPRLATLIVFGGWLLVEVAVLSFSKGIVHPYYVSAVGPGAAAMIGAGAVAFASLARSRHRGLALLPCAVLASVAAQLVILHEQGYMRWFAPVLMALVVVGMAALASRRLTGPAIALVLGALLIAPTAYATTTWLAPVEGTFPAAGPHEAIAAGAYGLNPADLRIYRALGRYVESHHPGTRWSVLTVASPTAAPLILFGVRAGSLAGYSGTDPALDGAGLARLVARREARYVVVGGAYASRGGNLATKAVLRSCRLVPASDWHGPPPQSIYTLVLFDCAGRERQLAGQPAAAPAPIAPLAPLAPLAPVPTSAPTPATKPPIKVVYFVHAARKAVS